ncbi:helitron helicase-like protein [Aphelenchoides avenae]|nr:helitron helicase-like protein [Aphelenchus avenae]
MYVFPTKHTSGRYWDIRLYRRREDVREFAYGSAPNQRRADNGWIVPYGPALLKKYSCHMNVAIVQDIRAVKYLYKYIFKGFDRAYLELASTDTVLEWDEITQHLDARYVSSSEACARLLRKPIHGRTHAVIRLHVHKPGQTPTEEEVADTDDPVVGEPELDEEAVGEAYDNLIQVDPVDQPADASDPAAQPVIGNKLVGGNHDPAPPMSDDEGDEEADPAGANRPAGSNRNIAPPNMSTLLAWLAYNAANDDGRHLTYVEFCSHFRFDKKNTKWIKRAKEVNVIGRLRNVSPRDH